MRTKGLKAATLSHNLAVTGIVTLKRVQESSNLAVAVPLCGPVHFDHSLSESDIEENDLPDLLKYDREILSAQSQSTHDFSSQTSVSRSVNITIRILFLITAHHSLNKLKVRLWDGTCWPTDEPAAATLVLNRPSSLREMLSGGSEASIGEAYVNKVFDIEGDFEVAFAWREILSAQSWDWPFKLKLFYLIRQLPDKNVFGQPSVVSPLASLYGHKHSRERDRLAIQSHYDISNEFYALWLDPQMVYSCAYFENESDSLETAQFNKLDYICRKLDLKPGGRLLDIGCGWGGLIIHAALHFDVQAEGITLSEKQASLARKRIDEAGLRGRVRVHIKDYRAVEECESYDAIASVGMVEHVGRKQLPEYFQQAYKLLKPGGLFLNHGIGLGTVPWMDQSKSFVDEFVFPDGELLPIHEMLDAAEKVHWEVRDVENLREHYTITLRHWVKRLETHREKCLQHVNEKIFRTWKLYMAGTACGFRDGHMCLYQTLLSKLRQNGRSFIPQTRKSWYQGKA